MVREKFAVRHIPEEQGRLERLARAGRSPARVATRARVLLKTGGGRAAPEVAQVLDVAESGAYRIKRRFAEDGPDGALRHRPQAYQYRKPDDRAGAHISPPRLAPRLPKGMTTGRCGAWRAGRWSWDWLRLCTMRACAAISKSAGKPWRSKRWRIPGVSADFVAHGEDVPDLYAEPCGPQRPVVCFGETPTRMLAGVRPPMPAKPGRVRREDCECRREGACNLFLSCEPEAGRRHVEITERRTKTDFARQMRRPVEDACPKVEVIGVVLDNLNTHRKAPMHEAFPAEEARRTARKLEFHHTPKHGSWLNMAEIEFSVISRRCLGQRHPDGDRLCREAGVPEQKSNQAQAVINRRFTIGDARTKLHRLYPLFPE